MTDSTHHKHNGKDYFVTDDPDGGEPSVICLQDMEKHMKLMKWIENPPKDDRPIKFFQFTSESK